MQYDVFTDSYPIKLICCHCYKPLTQNDENQVIPRKEEISKSAFLIHSSKNEDKNALDWSRSILDLYGIETKTVEDDNRAVDFLQKSKDGINDQSFIFVLLTKRYQYQDETGALKWKGPDKCYDEIAMSYMIGKDIFALIEKEVDPGRVLERVAWYQVFVRERGEIIIDNGNEFFERLDSYTGNVKLLVRTFKV